MIRNQRQPEPKPVLKQSIELPWDIYEIIISLSPLNEGDTMLYKNLRLINRDFYRFVCKRRTSLIFNDQKVTLKVFFDLVMKSTGNKSGALCSRVTNVKQFAIMKNIERLNATVLNKQMVPIKGLLQLDL